MNFFKSSEEKAALKKRYEEEEDASIKITNKPFTRNNILVCATHGRIHAIHKSNGSVIWETKFPTGAYGGVVSLFVTDADKLIVGARGRTAAMNLMTGETLWVNKMPNFGLEEVSILSTPSRFLSPNKQPEYGTEADAPPHYNEQVIPDKPIVLSCSMGKAMAMDIDTGETLWTYDCPGGRYKIPTALVEPASAEEGRHESLVYVGAGKWIYCLKARTGDVVWTSKVTDSIWGYGYMTMATPWSSRLAAEGYTAFSQQPVGQARDRERESEHANS